MFCLYLLNVLMENDFVSTKLVLWLILRNNFRKTFFFRKKLVRWGRPFSFSPSHVFMFSLFMFSRTISNVSFEPAKHFFIRCMHFDRVVHEVWLCNILMGKQNWQSHQKVNKHWKYRKVTTGYKKGYSTKLLVKSYACVTHALLPGYT